MCAAVVHVLLLAASAAAGPRPPGAVVRGALLEWETSPPGELSVRTATHEVFRFTFDAKTYFERDNHGSSAGALRKGDQVEIVSDGAPGVLLRYARTVHVVEQQPPRRTVLRPRRYGADRMALDQIAPMGNLTFAGVVRRLEPGRMVLRTRGQGDQTILLGQDTAFLENGVQVPASTLAPNTRVFVRGTRDFDDQVQAYQVVWGRILEPEMRP